MKTGKIRKKLQRLIAFLLCAIMVLGAGAQEIIGSDFFVVNAAENETPEDEVTSETSEESTEPEEPEEPTEPEDPEEPTEPETPSEDSEESTEPEVPETSSEDPEEPTEPEMPAEDPEEPTEPSEGEEALPAEVTNPETPDGQQPETPEAGDDSADPVTELVYEAEDGSYRIVVNALEDVDLSGIELHAVPAATEEASKLIYEAKPGMDVAGILAYEISFIYEETGEAADLSGQAAITIEYTAPELEEGLAEIATLAMFSLTDGSVSELTEADGMVLGEGTAEVLVGNYALYTLAWLVPADDAVTYETTVDELKVIVKADPGVIPEDAVLSATRVESEETAKEIKEAVADDILANNTTIQDMTVLDIKFLVDDQEVQPDGAVTVEFENTGYEAENGISVYHVDENNETATNMEATTETEADVAFETTHFSTYVIVNQGSETVTVTIEHYLEQDGEVSEKIYRTQVVQASSTDRITWSDYGSDEYRLDRIVYRNGDQDGEQISIQDDGELYVDANVTVRCYYHAVEDTYVNEVTFFDYDITSGSETRKNFDRNNHITIQKNGTSYTGFYRNNALYSKRDGEGKELCEFQAGDIFIYDGKECTWEGNGGYYTYVTSGGGYGINDPDNYASESNDSNRMMMGDSVQSGKNYSYEVRGYTQNNELSGKQYNININHSQTNETYPNSEQPIKKGIVTGLIDADNDGRYETVDFAQGLYEPGYFTGDEFDGKRILDGYKLEFDQSGNKYTLTAALNPNNSLASNAGTNFWPLDGNLGVDGYNAINRAGGYQEESDDKMLHNWYFAMRYDFEFTLGDYCGDLTYTFNGDDDMWVFLDGELILDMGGIHSGYPENDQDYNYAPWSTTFPNTVDLWEDIADVTDGAVTRDSVSEDGKAYTEETHTITVLLMERGGFGSNCEMEFVMPNVKPSSPVVTKEPRAIVQFTKKNTAEETVSGAGFTLYDDEACGEDDIVETAFSDSNGNVRFNTSLTAGTYYIKETTTPDGYFPSAEIYTVTVTLDGTTATATITDSDSNNINGVIYNQLISTAITTNKTAKVAKWDERTYNITLEASSIVQSVETAEAVQIVLVFDRSGSMNFRSSLDWSFYGRLQDSKPSDQVYYYIANSAAATVYRVWYDADSEGWLQVDDFYWDYDTGCCTDSSKISELEEGERDYYTTDDPYNRLHYLQIAANRFAADLAKMSPNSELALVTFTKYANGEPNSVNIDFALQEIGNKVGEFEGIVNGLTTMGGTQPSLGLDEAKEILNGQNGAKKQYVIFMTDGCPADDTYDNVAQSVRELLNTNYDRTLMTVAVGLGGNNKYLQKAKTFLQECASKVEYAFAADNADALPGVFETILGSITSNIEITSATIKDYIDPRFEVVKKTVTDLGGTVGTDANGQYVIWENQTITAGTASGAGWSKTFQVRAKDDYIGGNKVTTNGDDSGIIVEETLIPFDNPEVNVKIDLEVGNFETTIFKGDSVADIVDNVDTTDDVRDLLFDVDAIASQYSNSKDPLEADELSFTWYKDDTCTEELTEAELAEALLTPDETVTYYLKVKYTGATPVEEDDQCTINTGGHIAGEDDGTDDCIVEAVNDEPEKYDVVYYGVYKINVITGSLEITKTLDTSSDTDQEFTFTVTGPGSFKKEVTITVPADSNEAIALSDADKDALSGLARGEYTITEIPAAGYSVREIKTDGSNCKVAVSEQSSNSVTFTLGKYMEGETEKDTIKDNTDGVYDEGVKGVAAFTNEKVIADWAIKKLSTSEANPAVPNVIFELKSNTKTYYGQSNTDGIVEWYNVDPRDTENFDKETDKVEGVLEKGIYTLTELVSGTGYALNNETWTLVISESGGLMSITSSDESNNPMTGEKEGDITYFCYYNEALYDLPSAGGPGIYLYMLGGSLLMMAATLLVYKKRKEEVLRS